jgi:hypothetical protein
MKSVKVKFLGCEVIGALVELFVRGGDAGGDVADETKSLGLCGGVSTSGGEVFRAITILYVVMGDSIT